MDALSKANPLDKYKQAFREEAREILAELESVLPGTEQEVRGQGIGGRAFRALHTIKGLRGHVSVRRMATFTHNLETAFDEVRSGRLAVTPELVDLSLAALDQIKAMFGGQSLAMERAAPFPPPTSWRN